MKKLGWFEWVMVGLVALMITTITLSIKEGVVDAPMRDKVANVLEEHRLYVEPDLQEQEKTALTFPTKNYELPYLVKEYLPEDAEIVKSNTRLYQSSIDGRVYYDYLVETKDKQRFWFLVDAEEGYVVNLSDPYHSISQWVPNF